MIFGIFGKTKVMFRENLLDRITIEEGKRGGSPCIRGLRVRVVDITGYLAAGMSKEEILEDFPYLEENDIYAACEYVTMVLADFKPSSIKESMQLS
jgi:uncharacterized protein (DUF433 family)